ncbi:hypothetical protein E2C01_056912 [Portunus trituberculatus]|uniref:Uncharacterized protein n=1 Tax=Portunus trituberculatus TaxID=210409 RepID=A0A5B7GVF1_PORTR|nr:hypothetical protein [Portunus trituberculatus]
MQEVPHASSLPPHSRHEKCTGYFAKLYPDYFIWMSFGISLRKLEMRDGKEEKEEEEEEVEEEEE